MNLRDLKDFASKKVLPHGSLELPAEHNTPFGSPKKVWVQYDFTGAIRTRQ